MTQPDCFPGLWVIPSSHIHKQPEAISLISTAFFILACMQSHSPPHHHLFSMGHGLDGQWNLMAPSPLISCVTLYSVRI